MQETRIHEGHGTIHAPTSVTVQYHTIRGRVNFTKNLLLLFRSVLAQRPTLGFDGLKREIEHRAQCGAKDLEDILDGKALPDIRIGSRISSYFNLSLRMMLSDDLERHIERHLVIPKHLARK